MPWDVGVRERVVGQAAAPMPTTWLWVAPRASRTHPARSRDRRVAPFARTACKRQLADIEGISRMQASRVIRTSLQQLRAGHRRGALTLGAASRSGRWRLGRRAARARGAAAARHRRDGGAPLEETREQRALDQLV